MKLKWVFALVIASFVFLTGCNPGTEEIGSPTPPPSMNKTATREARKTFIAEYKATLNIEKTASPTQRATHTPRPTPVIEPPVPNAAYQLVRPELDSLVGQYFSYPETRDITQFLAEYYYPEGTLPYQSMLDYINHSDRITFFSPYFRNIVTQAISDYLVDNSLELGKIYADQSDAFEFSTQHVELDGDPEPELLVRVIVQNLYYQGWLTFNPSESGDLQSLSSPRSQLIYPFNYSYFPQYIDFDGDGIKDLFFMIEDYLGGGGNRGFVNIYRGSSEGYTLEYDYDYFYNSKWSDGYWFIKLGETDPPSVVVTKENSLNWGCEWTYTITVAWKNGKFRETHSGEQPPNTPECLIAQSVHWMDEFPESGIPNLTAAISQITNNPAYHPDLETFARFRLALLYAVDGDLSAARTQLEAIETLSENPEAEGAQFIAEQLPDILMEDQVKIHQLCLNINHTIQAGDPISNFWKQFLWVNSYPDDYNPRILCPTFTFMPTFFAALPSPGRSTLEQALHQRGITVLALESYTTEDGKTLWAGLFDAGALFVAAYQPNLEGVDEWDLLSWISYLPTDDWEWLSEDLNGDGHKEIAFSYSDPYWTRGEDNSYNIYLVTFDGTQIIRVSDYITQESLDLKQHILETYGQDILGSIREKEVQSCEEGYSQSTPWFRFDELLRASIGASCDNQLTMEDLEWWTFERDLDGEARDLLEHARGLVDLDDDYGPEAWQNLSYLIALSHGLDGHTCEAIARYLAVWESRPVSPWNALAASHLEAAGPDTNVPACSTE